MPEFFDDQSVDIPCPGCGSKTTKTVGWLKSNTYYTCGCGARINLQSNEFKRGLGDAERAVDDLRRKFRNFGR